jgi:bifunctional UDP-N-acetylglucosamine pyrophosphorylase/glucosamine-1-phosphate N-acetyltransferase
MTQVLILAAGKGKRMGGFLPKVLHEIEKKPMIEYLVDSVLASGVTSRPMVVIGYGTEIIKKYLGTKCNYVLQAEQLGTAHAVLCAKNYLEKIDDLLVLYGDHPFLQPETIANLEKIHKQNKNILTMMTLKLPNFDGWYKIFEDWGRIIRNSKGEIVAIVEKKDAAEEELEITEVNPALFCFQTAWLWENLSKINCDNAQNEYYLTDLVKIAISQKQKVETVTLENPFEAIGINTPEQLKLAQMLYQNKVITR